MNAAHDAVEIRDVRVAYNGHEALKGISLSIKRNERWCIIGPNGAGKSTLIKTVAGLVPVTGGGLRIQGVSIRRYTGCKRARALAYVPQKPDAVIPYTVHDFVMLGRHCMMGILSLPSANDREAVEAAVAMCDIGHLTGRFMNTLSGGELQRVLLAGAVAQSAPLLLLDEPTAFLDPAHEHLFFDALSRLHRHRELTTVLITHDVNNALLQCTHIAALSKGSLVFSGTTTDFRAECPAVLEDIYSTRFKRFVSDETSVAVYGSWGLS